MQDVCCMETGWRCCSGADGVMQTDAVMLRQRWSSWAVMLCWSRLWWRDADPLWSSCGGCAVRMQRCRDAVQTGKDRVGGTEWVLFGGRKPPQQVPYWAPFSLPRHGVVQQVRLTRRHAEDRVHTQQLLCTAELVWQKTKEDRSFFYADLVRVGLECGSAVLHV